MATQGKRYPSKDHLFTAKWLPGESWIKVGPDNLIDMQNVRWTDGGVEQVPGYSKINTTALGTHPVMTAGIQAINPITGESHVLVAAEDADGTEKAIYVNEATVPAQGNFNATVLHTADEDAGGGRFCHAPGGEIVHANGRETLVYGSGAMPVRGFIASSAAVGDFASDAIDYKEQVNNDRDGIGDLAYIGGGNDSYTKLLLHFDGTDGSTTITDETGTHTVTAVSGAELDTDQAKFGTASGKTDDNTEYFSVPDHNDFAIGASNDAYTVDFWARWATDPTAYRRYFMYQNDGNAGYYLWYDSGNQRLRFQAITSGAPVNMVSYDWTPDAGQWYHIALIVTWSGSTGTWRLAIDGEIVATATVVGLLLNGTSAVWIDYTDNGLVSLRWIDELRVSKGIARWTSDFAPPPRPYTLSRLHFVVISNRALQGITPTVKSANPLSAPTLTGKTWNGRSWSDLVSLTDGTSGLSVAGANAITFNSTVGIAERRYLEGYHGYCYLFSLSDGDASLSRVTVDAPVQPITDVWDGFWRTAIQFHYKFDTATEELDKALDVAELTPSGIDVFADSFAANVHGLWPAGHIEMGFENRTTAVRIWLWLRESGYVNGAASVVTVSYWDGEDFVPCSGIIDGTSDAGATLGKSGVISWNPPSPGQEFKREHKGIKLYFYRFTFSARILGTTGIGIDLVQGIPAPEQRLGGCDFPFRFQSRVFLVTGNKAHYCVTDDPAKWNGDDSSYGFGRKPIEFGDGTPVRAAISIFNRFGSSLLDHAVVLKKKGLHLLSGYDADTYRVQDVSTVIGISAVNTLDAAEVAYRMDDARRNLVVWLSYSGPILFDAGTPIHASGEIACYFDKLDSRCVNYSAIETSWGILDPDTNTYHLCIPTGSATTPDTWLCLDLVRNKWFKLVPAGTTPYPRGAMRVMDDDGAQYVYLLMADGRMLRLNHGATWDGEAIDWLLEIGDFAPTGKFMEKVKTQRIAVLMEAVAETDAAVTVTHFRDGATSGTVVDTMSAYHATDRYVRKAKKFNREAMAHRLRFSGSTDETVQGVPLIAWNLEIADVRTVGGG